MPGEGRTRDVLHRPVLGAGEVAGDPQDDGRQDDADDHGDRGEQRGAGPEVELGDLGVEVGEVGEAARQVHERDDTGHDR